MESIYIAKSKSFPNLVKIGRTDRPVDVRMGELSKDDYGPTGFVGDSEWEAVRKRNAWVNIYNPDKKFVKFLEKQTVEMTGLLKNLGVIK